MSDADADPASVLPVETAKAQLLHWWREPIAGLCSLAIGAWDTWHYGRDAGLSSSVDELLIIGGVVLIAGSRRFLAGSPPRRDDGKNGS